MIDGTIVEALTCPEGYEYNRLGLERKKRGGGFSTPSIGGVAPMCDGETGTWSDEVSYCVESKG